MDAVATMVPPPLALIAGRRGRDAVDDAVEVDRHGATVGLGIEVVAHAAPRGDSGVEVCDVKAAEGLDRARHGGLAGCGVGHVGLDEVPAQLVGDGAAASTVDVGDDDVRTIARQVPGHALADAVAAAGDQGDLAVHIECHGDGS